MQFWSLRGYVPYRQVQLLQQELVKLRYLDRIPDTVLFLEHQPVITRGRGLQFTGSMRPRQIPLMKELPADLEYVESERGGDLTYHGPGQWVMYPVFKLDGQGFAPERDVAGFLRKLEAVIIDELAERGLRAEAKPNATGVWLNDRKVASLGIAIRKWVSYHGLALNCMNDLNAFYFISPCGFSPDIMTRLSDWIPLDKDWRNPLEISIARRLFESFHIQSMDLGEANEKAKRLCSELLPRLP